MQDKKLEMSAPKEVSGNDVTTWALPKGAVARLGRGREPDMTFSPDGQSLAIGTSLGLWLYDLATLCPIALWETERGMVGRVAFSSNGKWLAASNSDQILKVLDIQNGGCLTQVETDDYITGMTFSPDNRYIAAAYALSSTVEIWHSETGESLAKFTTDTEDAGFHRPIAFSPDTRLIASTNAANTDDDGEVTAEAIVIWDVESRERIACLIGHTYSVTTLCFSPCGQFLASGGEDGTVYVWDVDTWQQVQVYTDFGDVYRIIPSYSPDGTLRAAIVNYDNRGPATISVRNLESGEQLYTDKIWGNTVAFSNMDDWGNTVAFAKGSQLAYECRHTFINVWTPEHPYRRQLIHSPSSFPTSVVFSQDGKTLAAKHHHEGVVLWDIVSKRSRPAIEATSAGKNQFVYPPIDVKLHVASIQEDNVRLWEADGNGTPLVEGTGREYCSAFPTLAPTGTLFAYADAEGNVQVWNVQNGKKLYELIHPLCQDDDDDKISKLMFSPDGHLLVSVANYTTARLWDMKTGKEIDAFMRHKVYCSIIGFSPCGRYLVCEGEEILLWDIAHCEFHKPGLNQGPFSLIEFSPDGKYLACSSGTETFLYDLKRSEIHIPLSLPQECERLYAAAFSSCGRYLAGGTWWQEGLVEMPVCLWEVSSGKHIVTFWGHPTDVQTLAFSPDNTLLASASYDGSILLWDLKSIIGS